MERHIRTYCRLNYLDEESTINDFKSDIESEQKKRNKKIIEVEKMLRLRLGEHKGDPDYKKFAEKLDELLQVKG